MEKTKRFGSRIGRLALACALAGATAFNSGCFYSHKTPLEMLVRKQPEEIRKLYSPKITDEERKWLPTATNKEFREALSRLEYSGINAEELSDKDKVFLRRYCNAVFNSIHGYLASRAGAVSE